ncbi:uncharacterized protein LOC134188211 [Corticium candelabrum]|uniref:uncharacterized protein LOC134188211 n=1 Tax=Corticium candelabrum TaxID=121492 RepID=UPI002E25DF6B|nr:uncharacterized protein LOC134188211 [Corticium candelabrum]
MLQRVGVTCTQTCKDSYHKLLGNAIGRDFYQCNCGTGALSATCQSFTNNLLSNCFGGVAPTPPPVVSGSASTVVVQSCSSVTSSCGYNPTCKPRYMNYIQSCSTALLGVRCSSQCNQSFYELLRHPVGSQFLGCSCGDASDCSASLANFYGTCYNGSIPVAPPTVVIPTSNPPGTCEAFQEKCYTYNYGTCGLYFLRLNGLCNETCRADCVNEMQNLLLTIPYAREILTCSCKNATNSICRDILAYQREFLDCLEITLPPAVVTSTPTQFPRDSCEGLHQVCIQQLGAQCASLQQQVFEGNCSYLNAQGAANLSLPCTDDCQSSLQTLAASSHGTVLTCSCADSGSSVCLNVTKQRAVFNHCGVTPAPPVATSSPTSNTNTLPTKGSPGGSAKVAEHVLSVIVSVVIGHVLLML